MEVSPPIVEELDKDSKANACTCERVRLGGSSINLLEVEKSAKGGCLMCYIMVQAGHSLIKGGIRSGERVIPTSKYSIQHAEVGFDRSRFFVHFRENEENYSIYEKRFEFICTRAS
jgi:hypothetical protein